MSLLVLRQQNQEFHPTAAKLCLEYLKNINKILITRMEYGNIYLFLMVRNRHVSCLIWAVFLRKIGILLGVTSDHFTLIA